jgi:hypothetical protein
MPAHVEQDVDAPGTVTGDEKRVVHDAAHHEVARVGDLGFVGQELPRPGEEALALELEQPGSL